jgi:signal transduction histidine kinase
MQFRSFDNRARWLVIAPFLVAVAMLAGLAAASIDILAAARAYVGGESLWSKSEKDAVFHLTRYAQLRQEADYQRFVEAMAVPLGGREARLELDRPDPDLRVVRHGLLQGHNHPDDIDSMVRLYRRFRDVAFMRDSAAIWADADAHIDELRALAELIRARFAEGDTDSAELQGLIAQIEPLNLRLTRLGERFATTLSDAARVAENLVLWGSLATGAALAAVGIGLSWYLMRREAQIARALRESTERWTLATEAAGIGVFDWDLGHDHVSVDARTAVLYGLPGRQATFDGRVLSHDRVHADDAPRLRQALQGATENRVPVRVRYRVQAAPGDWRHLQLNARTRVRGDVTRLIGIVSDVSDDVQAQQLRLDKESAERANREKSDFLSRVSHELRTPLNAVLGFAQLMHTDPFEPLTSSQNQRIQQVLDNGKHLLELINDLLDLTGMERDTLCLNPADVSLAPVVAASLAQVQKMARAAKVSTACRMDPGAEVLSVHVDAPRLEQALVHLLTNAVKYNRPGGQVELRVRRDAGSAVLAVRDTGAGMSAEQLERLFQPFDRLGAENTKVAGSGIGLAITQQLAQRMGGSLAVSSEPGNGTCAELRVPLRSPLEVSEPTSAPASLSPRDASRVGGGSSSGRRRNHGRVRLFG